MTWNGNILVPEAAEMRELAAEAKGERSRLLRDERSIRRHRLDAEYLQFLEARPPDDAPYAIGRSIRKAAARGETRLDVFRFASEFCVDSGRRINCCEPGWPETLHGAALRYYELLHAKFLPRGFVVGAEIVTWPQLMPGDVALFLLWDA